MRETRDGASARQHRRGGQVHTLAMWMKRLTASARFRKFSMVSISVATQLFIFPAKADTSAEAACRRGDVCVAVKAWEAHPERGTAAWSGWRR